MMQKPAFVNNHFYHIYNRGVEKRQIFMDESDYFRFIHNLFEFNDTAPAGKFSNGLDFTNKKRDLLVRIHAFCLMPNHYHIILEQLQNGGIQLFMRKLGTGYSMYFNEKYERVGSLFQNRFKAIIVEHDQYLLGLLRYIHLNPLDKIQSDWRTDGINNWKKANDYLKDYRWSSHPNYLGKNNFPSVIYKAFLEKFFKSSTDYKKFINQFLDKDYYNIKDLLID